MARERSDRSILLQFNLTKTTKIPLSAFSLSCSPAKRILWLAFVGMVLFVGRVQASPADEECRAEDGECRASELTEDDCVDVDPDCLKRITNADCATDPAYMLKHCRKSCHICGSRTTPNGTVETFYGVPQQRVDETDDKVFQMMENYMLDTVLVDEAYASVRGTCRNQHEHCVLWSSRGECQKNPKMMRMECAPACRSCHALLDPKDINVSSDPVCRVNPEADVWKEPGELDQTFRKIIHDYGDNVTILSSPDSTPKGPWLVTIDDFLTPEESDHLIQMGHMIGYDPSLGVVVRKEDGSIDTTYDQDFRTSKTAWCHSLNCYNEATMKKVQERIASMTGTPVTNAQYMQLIKYEVGEYYKYHHDFDDPTLMLPPGPRILTVFIYLNTVPAGGGTRFDLLDTTVSPKKGRAVIWPSVAQEDFYKREPGTYHQGMPVEEGLKYALNQQIHMRDYRQPHAHDCAY